MAPKTTAPVGSAQWIQAERDQADAMIQQEVEDFGFSVRNEMEWLNEHMGDVFTNANLNFADIFKTPGKLRGKTPRTARKVNPVAAPRQPLTDIFAPNTAILPPSAQKNAFYDKVANFQIAEDKENAHRSKSRSKSPQRLGKPGYIDSGYHGMTEDELEDARTESATASSQQGEPQKVPLREDQPRPQPVRTETMEGGRTSDQSFMSAKEDLASRNASREQLQENEEEQAEDDAADNATIPDEHMDVDEAQVEEPAAADDIEHLEPELVEDDMDAEAPGSPSDTSSPEKPLQRKSSFTFSALPAREPLTAKRSIGARNSQFDAGRNSTLGRSFGAKTVDVANEDEDDYQHEPTEEAKVHSKTSTQSLHERIMMLGKTKEPRTSKSIPQSTLGAQALYPQLPAADADEIVEPEVPVKDDDVALVDEDEDDDDWIAPSKPMQGAPSQVVAEASTTPRGSPSRPSMHQKSISTTNIPPPSRPMVGGHHKSQSVSNPSMAEAAGLIQSTTPVGSPMGKRPHEGILSASKNKLWSTFKSAKGIFASSASASAAAKLEAHNSPAPQRSPKREFEDFGSAPVFNMPGALYSATKLPPQSPARPVSAVSSSPSRKTRSSSESDKKRGKELKAQQKATEALEKVREKERAKAAKEQEERRKADEAEAAKKAANEQKEAEAAAKRPVSADSDSTDMPPPPPPKSVTGKLRAPTRFGRPTRGEPAARPAPVSIRVASQSQRLGQGPQSSLSKSQHESMAPPPPPKSSLRTTSAQGNVRSSTAPNNARVKALEAAARKKEADERAAQKKLEQKRELERKRAAKAEEERRLEDERKAAEQVRIVEAKQAAQRKAEQQAAEARKREQQRQEQYRQQQQEEAQRAKAAHDLAEAIKRERAAQPSAHPRGDVGGTLRQLTKNSVQEQSARPPIHPNPAKPAKRLFQAEDDEASQSQQRPGMQRAPPSYQQTDAKRRRTNEEQEEPERHSVMAPPKRPSNMRKESTLKVFPHGYSHAPPPASHHASSIFKSTVTAQHQMQHGGKAMPTHPSQTVQMSNARIPFAENSNPPASQHGYQQSHAGYENAHPNPNKFKTPARPAQAPSKSARSSPMYPKGDAIELPEIQTDSEDDSDDSESEATGGFRAPSWVASPALRDLLTQQQLVDPETVFGPIAELKMDEVFRNGKNAERVKRFRDRGSSAMWVETGDAVTSAEKRRDMEVRERVAREGGWRYEPGN